MTKENGLESPDGALDELTKEVKRVIEDNRKFLDRIMDDEFEDEPQPDEEPPEEEL